ncbi:MAG: hypothetical protein JOZ87_26855 [Chloroflexi bacterium]|nr:hypothetical protein [Chloroflexota bacterium]
MRIRAGTRLPLVASAVGRAFLAYLPPDATEPVLERELESGISQVASAEDIDRLKYEVPWRVWRIRASSSCRAVLPSPRQCSITKANRCW